MLKNSKASSALGLLNVASARDEAESGDHGLLQMQRVRRPPVPWASTNPVCERSHANSHHLGSGVWAQAGLPRRVSSTSSTVTGGYGAGDGAITWATNALWTMDRPRRSGLRTRRQPGPVGDCIPQHGPQSCRQPRAGPH
jgi:hypothetical protein